MVRSTIPELLRRNALVCNSFTWWSTWCWSQWPRGLRRRSTAARLLRSWVRIPRGAWMFVCCERCQVEVSATSWSLVQRSPTDCGASFVWSRKPQEWGGHGPRWAAAPQEKKNQLATGSINGIISSAQVISVKQAANFEWWIGKWDGLWIVVGFLRNLIPTDPLKILQSPNESKSKRHPFRN